MKFKKMPLLVVTGKTQAMNKRIYPDPVIELLFR